MDFKVIPVPRGFVIGWVVGLSLMGVTGVRAEGVMVEARCQAEVLSFGAGRSERWRADYLCADATSIAPAQCYWNALSFGATDAAKFRVAKRCRSKAAVVIPVAIQRCVLTTQAQLNVSPSSALNVCTEAFYRR